MERGRGNALSLTEGRDGQATGGLAVEEEARNDPATLEISTDTKAKVSLGLASGKTSLVRVVRLLGWSRFGFTNSGAR